MLLSFLSDLGKASIVGLLLIVVAPFARAEGPTQLEVKKKLIEFGWDEPDTAFMRQHVAEMEKTPFDGCVFHVMATNADGKRENFTWLCWGTRAFSEAELHSAVDDLKATPFQRFTHNFLRFNVTPGKIDWFDNFDAIVANARLAAHVAREGKCPGILFDIEEYESKLFTYTNQRDAKTKSWDEYAAQVKKRGAEVMAAFQEGYPDLVVFLTFGYSLPNATSMGKPSGLPQCSYGLLAPFLDGMVEASRGKAKIVDGYELAYGYKEKAQFERGRETMLMGVLPLVADQDRYPKVISPSFGLWMDYDWRGKGWNGIDASKNPLTPEVFGRSVRFALEQAEEYVWVYTETPRWWSEKGKSIDLPGEYEAAIREARKGLAKE